MTKIAIIPESTFTEAQLISITRLLFDIFVTDGRAFEQMHESMRARVQKRTGTPEESTSLVIWENEEPIAHAGYFLREIHTAAGKIPVGALWGVCVRETHRGKGLGARLVKEFFQRMDRGLFPVGLWHTGVPDFYAKLGARTIENTFTNSQDPENPTADPWPGIRMIYPAAYPWPEGIINLNGPGY